MKTIVKLGTTPRETGTDWTSGRGRHCRVDVDVDDYGWQSVWAYRPRRQGINRQKWAKNGCASRYGAGDIGIRVTVGLRGVMGSPGL